jgi:hypothetical protein
MRGSSLYSLPDIIRVIKSRRMEWIGHVACVGEKRNTYKVLVGEPERKRPLEKRRPRWEDKMNLKEIGWECVKWICLSQDRDQRQAFVNMTMNLQVP